MFGLLKKSDFDAEMIFLRSQISSEINDTFTKSSLNVENINDIQNKLLFLTKVLNDTQEQLRQNQNIILNLKSIVEKLNNVQIDFQYTNLNTDIDFITLTYFLEKLYSNKTCLTDDKNRILEGELEKEISNYLKNQQNVIVSSKKNYPNFPLNYYREADILTTNQNQEIQSIIELKRWDIAYRFDREEFGCTIHSDRALHYIALNKLALSKSVNPQIKHYYICVYENNEIFKKGYIAAKKQSNSAGYGPFVIKQDTARFIDFDKIKKEYSINYEISDEQKNILENSFKKMYLSSGVFDFDYIDNVISNNKFRNIFLKKQCRVIQDKQINNTNLNQQQINNYSEKELAVLPVNWRIRIIEVL